MKELIFLLVSFFNFAAIAQQVDLVTPLVDTLFETSGLILLDDRLITHNDSGGETALFEIDTFSGGVARKVVIGNASNVDWEDVCYDDTYIYIGDFGNNAGTRTNLRVYRVTISDYLNTPNDTISADTILFNYADQIDFTSATFSTNYDAEALISWNDSLYIFTKNWGNMWTNVYALPKTPGNYSLPRIDSVNVEGFITGGCYNDSSNSIVLSGHTITYPFVVEISNFTNSQFSSATVERTQFQFPSGYSYQFEGITPITTNNYYISCEEGQFGSNGLFRFDIVTLNSIQPVANEYFMYPNPVSDILRIDCPEGTQVDLYSLDGKLIKSMKDYEIDVSDFSKGSYLLVLTNSNGEFITQEKLVIH